VLEAAAEAVLEVVKAVADGEITSEEKGDVLSELSDLPKKSTKPKAKKPKPPVSDEPKPDLPPDKPGDEPVVPPPAD